MGRLEYNPYVLAVNARNTRKALGCTGEEMARLLDIPPDIVSRYEDPSINSFPTKDKLAVLCRLAGVDEVTFTADVVDPRQMKPLDAEVLLESAPPLRLPLNEAEVPLTTPAPAAKAFIFTKSMAKGMVRLVVIGLLMIALALVSYINSMKNKTGYYVTQGSDSYHLLNCSLLEEAEGVAAVTVVEAEEQGYAPCGVCIPVTDE